MIRAVIRRIPLTVVVLGALLLGTPMLYATAEVWTDGIYDSETNEGLHIISGAPAIVDLSSIQDTSWVFVVVARVGVLPAISIGPIALSATETRAPPTV